MPTVAVDAFALLRELDAGECVLVAGAGLAAHLDRGEAGDAFDDEIACARVELEQGQSLRIDIERTIGAEFAVVGECRERQPIGQNSVNATTRTCEPPPACGTPMRSDASGRRKV